MSAGDRPGLLYDLAKGPSHLGLNVRMAKVSTLGDRARDAFYVVEHDQAKITNPARKKDVTQVLLGLAQGRRR